jgi:hypothetical protein
MLTDFLFDLIQPILPLQYSGFYASVGYGPDAKVFKMFPFLCGFIGDNKGLEQLVGISCQKKFNKCRMCTSRLCTIIPVHEHAIKKNLAASLVMINILLVKFAAMTSMKTLVEPLL